MEDSDESTIGENRDGHESSRTIRNVITGNTIRTFNSNNYVGISNEISNNTIEVVPRNNNFNINNLIINNTITPTSIAPGSSSLPINNSSNSSIAD